jgi:hypothetical protein
MLPTKQQWTNYSLLEKWGAISALATVLGLIFAVYVYLVPPASPLSISDKVMKDDNPTKLKIEKVELKHWLGDSEPYVTVVIKNTSSRTALRVIPSFVGEDGYWKFTPTKTSSLYANGVAIESQAVTEFPVAPVSEFLRKLQPRCPGCYLVAIDNDANIPDHIQATLCKQSEMVAEGCQVSSLSTPTPITIRYKTIFDEKAEKFTSQFTYLSKNVPTSYLVPSR